MHRALPGEVAVREGGCIQSSSPPAVWGQQGRHSRGQVASRPRICSLGGPSRHLEPTWLLEALTVWAPSPALPPFPQSPGMTHREVPKVRTTAGFSSEPWNTPSLDT